MGRSRVQRSSAPEDSGPGPDGCRRPASGPVLFGSSVVFTDPSECDHRAASGSLRYVCSELLDSPRGDQRGDDPAAGGLRDGSLWQVAPGSGQGRFADEPGRHGFRYLALARQLFRAESRVVERRSGSGEDCGREFRDPDRRDRAVHQAGVRCRQALLCSCLVRVASPALQRTRQGPGSL